MPQIQETKTVLGILRASERVRGHFHDLLEPWGLTAQQYNVLRILRDAGDDGLPTLEVGNRLVEKTPGVTRLLDRLEEKGWVRRVRSQDDRRKVFCFATKGAQELLAELDGPATEVDRVLLAKLSGGQQKELEALAARIGL